MNANDQYKQRPETDIGPDNPKRPELEGTDGGNVWTDVISPQEGASDGESDEPPVLPPKEDMGGSEHSQSEFTHKNNDMNANDQYKQGPEADIGTDNPMRPELEGTTGCGARLGGSKTLKK